MNWLDNEKYNVTSQRGEDGIIAAIFSVIKPINKWCIEIGAGNGYHLSNTWNLINNQGWNSVQIENNHRRFRQLQEKYKNNGNIHCVNAFVVSTMDQELSQTSCPKNPDLLVIDIDGDDYHLWSYTNLYHPRVVMIEFNPTIPFWETFINPIQESLGSSLTALVTLGKEKGYELAYVTEWNAFFVKKSLFFKLKIKDNSVWLLAQHTVKYITYVYQSFDNQTKVGGANKRLWGKGKVI